MNWLTLMELQLERIPLEGVAGWWCDAWIWRTTELADGRGNPYDWDPTTRVPRSMVRAKFPWLTLEDEVRLAGLCRAEAKRRGLADLLRATRRYQADADTERRIKALGL